MFSLHLKIKRTIAILLVIVICLAQMLFTPLTVNANSETIRVAFIPDGSFYLIDSNGDYSGYNYEYLMKISQYTNWQYEFILIDKGDIQDSYDYAFELLEKGEIDLVGNQEITLEALEYLEFGDQHYSVSRTTLSSLSNNHNVTPNNYFLNESLRGVLVKSETTANKIFEDIMIKLDITPEIIYVDNREQAIQMLVEENADVIMSTDFSINHNTLSTLYTDNPVPIYFVAKKGNTELVDKLDYALEQIQVTTLNIAQDLQLKYFGDSHTSNLIRTVAENQALENITHLNVAFVYGIEPYQFYDEKTGKFSGIAVDIFDDLSKIIDFKFEYHWYENYQDLIDDIAEQKIDIFATLPTDYKISNDIDVSISQPYISNRASWIYRFDTFSSYEQAYKYFVSDNVPFYLAENIEQVYDGIEVFERISHDGDIVLFCDPYIAEYAVQHLNITNLEIRSIPDVYSNISMGVAKHIDPVILGLLNHAILHLDSYSVDESIRRNTILNEEITLKSYFENHILELAIYIFIIFTIIVLSLIFYVLKFRKLSRQDGLTKLVNAGYFHKYADDNTKKMDNGCLIIIDIDNFKQINDTHGHQVGDDIIKKVSDLLLKSFRSQDVIGRLGGDEFVVLLKYNASIDELNNRAKYLLETLDEQTDIDVTLSIGGLSFTEPMYYDNLYRLADEVLYSVKSNGRNGYAFKKYPLVVEDDTE